MADAETILRQLIEKLLQQFNYNLPEITIRALTSGGANYTSTLFSATVLSSNNDTLNLFAKVANVNEKIRKIMKVGMLFSTEDFAYTHLANIYNKLQEKHAVPIEERFTFPKYYGSNLNDKEEAVVLEDLVDSGYGMYSRFKSVDWEHMAVAVKNLAKFHALSFAYRKEDPVDFERTLERVKVVPDSTDSSDTKEMWGKMMGGAIQVVKEEYKERLSEFLRVETSKGDYFKFRMPLSTPVLCHGDYRISNIMFRRNRDLKPIAVDYQLLHSGTPVADLMYLEFMGTDEQFRREYHQRMLDYYYEQLSVAMGRLGVDSAEYSRETFDSEFTEMLPLCLRVSTIILPLVTVEAERAPRLGGGEADVSDIALTPNQLFAERFRGIVNDCVRWGAL